MADATLKQVADYFKQDGETLSKFSTQWKELSDQAKADLKKGIGDGTLNY